MAKENRETLAAAFGALLFAARQKANVTQEGLEYRSAIHRTEISQLELGQRAPRLDTVVKLAGALGVEPSELIPDIRWSPPLGGPDKPGHFRRT